MTSVGGSLRATGNAGRRRWSAAARRAIAALFAARARIRTRREPSTVDAPRLEQPQRADGGRAREWDGQIPPDGSEFDAFFTHHLPAIYGYVRRLVEASDVASDIAQETFLRAWTHFDEVRGYAHQRAWLYRVATNLAMSHLRSRHTVSLSAVARREGDHADADMARDSEALATSNLEEVTAERDLVNQVLARLPEKQRAALLLRAVHGFSSAEVAGMLGASVANVYQMVSRAAKQFRDVYEATQWDGAARPQDGAGR